MPTVPRSAAKTIISLQYRIPGMDEWKQKNVAIERIIELMAVPEEHWIEKILLLMKRKCKKYKKKDTTIEIEATK